MNRVTIEEWQHDPPHPDRLDRNADLTDSGVLARFADRQSNEQPIVESIHSNAARLSKAYCRRELLIGAESITLEARANPAGYPGKPSAGQQLQDRVVRPAREPMPVERICSDDQKAHLFVPYRWRNPAAGDATTATHL